MDLTEFCGEQFMDFQNEVCNTTNPQFSNCFQQLGCTVIPCAYLFIFALPYYITTRRKQTMYIPTSILFKMKMFITGVLWLFSWTDLIFNIVTWSRAHTVPAVNLISPLILGVAMALALLLTHFDRMKGVHSSGLLSGYWFFLTTSWVLICKAKVELLIMSQLNETKNLSSEEILKCVIFFLSYAGVIFNFILCFFSDKASTVLFKVNETELIGKSSKDSDSKFSTHPPSPELEATFFSKLFFQWVTRLMITGYKRSLVDGDLWRLNKANRSFYVTKRFFDVSYKDVAQAGKALKPRMKKLYNKKESNSEKQKEVFIKEPSVSIKDHKKKQSLLYTLVKTFGPTFLTGSLLKIFKEMLVFVGPQLLSLLIAFVSSDSPQWHGYVIAAGLFLNAAIKNILSEQHFHICFIVGLRIRSAIITAIYRKSLVLSSSSRKQSTSGEIANLMSVDAQRFVEVTNYINVVWSVPLKIIISLYFLWGILGPSVLAGFAVLLILIPINLFFASKATTVEFKKMTYKDARLKLLSDIFNGMKVLKMYAWEMSFKEKVSEIRNKELGALRKASYLIAVSTFTFVCAPILVSISTFTAYVLSDDEHVLDAKKAFVSLAYFHILRAPLFKLPMVIMQFLQSRVSLKRIQAFLDLEELDPDSVSRDENATAGEVAVFVRNGTFAWEKGGEDILSDINMSVKEGSLVAIVGQVGCGKSSLISALLGEMMKTNGNVSVKGSVAYVPQQPWIQNMSVRDNITFGKSFNAKKYQDTVEACELIVDFNMLPAGDDTEIGEKGINLSGGQKQRVSVARAVYQDTNVYLFDDPLSAVDAHVGKNIFDHVIGQDGCLKSKTRILVTHGLTYLPQVDQIFVVVGGCISEVGTYQELLSQNGAFAGFLRSYAQFDDDTDVLSTGLQSSHFIPEAFSLCENDSGAVLSSERQLGSDSQHSHMSHLSTFSQAYSSVSELPPLNKKNKAEQRHQVSSRKEGKRLIEAEKAETGNLKLSVVVTYIKAVGCLLTNLTLFFFFLQSVAQVCASIWLSEWSNDPISANGTQNGTKARLGVFGALSFTQAIASMVATFILVFGTVRAASTIHHTMLSRIFRAPMSFFDTTPLGRILNRFSNDMDSIEVAIPRNIEHNLQDFFQILTIVVCIIYSTPIMIVPSIPLLVLYSLLQRFYVRTSRQLARIESISRSPIYSHFSETVTGATSIRAFNKQNTFIKHIEAKVDKNQMSYYPKAVSGRWLAIGVQLIGNLIVLFASIFAVASKGSINSGLVGLSVSYAMQITETMSWMIKQVSIVESQIVAVERVKEYSQVDQEAPLVEDDRPSNNWPTQGEVTFQGYSTKYRSGLDLMVKDISFHVKSGEKIGIVGRTGAGKSSLTLALFRILEPELGSITIDGKNISKIGLQDLRSKLSIIPQDPVLFAGTLRLNLDPFDQYSDDALWDALKYSHLKDIVMSLPARLEHEVSEGGDNLRSNTFDYCLLISLKMRQECETKPSSSLRIEIEVAPFVGQRQLVCLARSLLRRSKILILDEATAAVDMATECLIQETIRREFKDCTVFTIAHRINTIMDSTRILVLDAGKVAEFDTPSNLLEKEGIFYGMAKEARLV